MTDHNPDNQPISREIPVPDWVKQADRVAVGVRSTNGLSMVAGQNVLSMERARTLAEAWLRLRKLITEDDPKRYSPDPADYRFDEDGDLCRFEGADWYLVHDEDLHRIPPDTRETLGVKLPASLVDNLHEPELADDDDDGQTPVMKIGDRAFVRGTDDQPVRAIVTEGPKMIDGVPHYRADSADEPNAKANPTWLAIMSNIQPADDEAWKSLEPPPKN